MTIGACVHFAKAAVLSVLIAAAPVVASAEAAGKYYERSFVLAAHRRCALFQPGVVSALQASAIQARGAALRAGVTEASLSATARRADGRAASTRCDDAQLRLVRDRVQGAFSGWARTPRMTFPGHKAAWSADRSAFEGAGWRLMQPAIMGASPVTFGVSATADDTQQISAVVSFFGRPRPYAARIVMRDPALAARPWLTSSGRAVLPPSGARHVVWSTGSRAADPTLLRADRKRGEAWTFPEQTGAILARLDPREPFVVEFLFRDDSRATAVFEVGDFAAGQAFVRMGSPERRA